MANPEHLKLIQQGVKAWNEWRDDDIQKRWTWLVAKTNFPKNIPYGSVDFRRTVPKGSKISDADINTFTILSAQLNRVDLSGAYLEGLHLEGANLCGANLTKANLDYASLRGANLFAANLEDALLEGTRFEDACLAGATVKSPYVFAADFVNADLRETDFSSASLISANLSGADLRSARLRGAWLNKANFCEANLTGADLSESNLTETNFSFADLTDVNLNYATLIKTVVSGAVLKNCKIYGLSAWDVKGSPRDQYNLVITPEDEPAITVDDLQVAQFIYLLLSNLNVRTIIDTLTSKVVLILGRFSEDRKAVLDAIREELRKLNFTPILFDFNKPTSKDVTGTVEILARMARFIIADLTDPSSIPHELATIVPFLRTTPVLPIQLQGAGGYSMFEDWQRSYQWVLETYQYKDRDSLIAELPLAIAPANEMSEMFRKRT